MKEHFYASPQNQLIMKTIFTLVLFFIALYSSSQSHRLKLTNTKKTTSTFIEYGDNVLLAVKVPGHQVFNKPSEVYILSTLEVKDSIYVFTKGRVQSINDSAIIIRERNSVFSATNREIRVSRINTIKKLTTGNQLFRTVTHTGGWIAFGVMVFYSYAAVGGGEGFITGMFEASCIGPVLTSFGRTKISKKHLNKSTIEVVPVP